MGQTTEVLTMKWPSVVVCVKSEKCKVEERPKLLYNISKLTHWPSVREKG